jgi:hypothetical protein
MGFFDFPGGRAIKHWLGWILRPRLAYLRIREAMHARNAPPVRNNLSLSALPIVTLRLAETPEDLSLVVNLYKRNPSSLTIAPLNTDAVEKMIACNTEFYRIFNIKGEHIGNIAFQVNRRMLSHLTIEYAHRCNGLGLATELAIKKLLVERGIDKIYAQVYRINRRALTHCLSFGYKMVEEQSTQEYFVLRKVLIP